MKLLELFNELTLHPKNAEEVKGLIFELAVRGRLTRKWRESSNRIGIGLTLSRFSEDREKLRREKIKVLPRLRAVEKEEQCFQVPREWKWERLGNIGHIFNGNSVNKSLKENRFSGLAAGYPYIATKDVGYGFDSINYDNGVRIPIDEPKFRVVRANSVIICSEGGSAGKKMGIITQDCCFGNKLFALEEYGNIEPLFILIYYCSASFRVAFRKKMKGIIGGVSKRNFSNLPFPLPPPEEQKEIVQIVNSLLTEVKQLTSLTQVRLQLEEDYVTSALKKLVSANDTAAQWKYLQPHFADFFNEKSSIQKLRETILQLAVQGKLTAEWRAANPNVEPASKLLERIQEKKQRLIAEKKIRKEKLLADFLNEDAPNEIPASWEWSRMQFLCPNISSGSTPPKAFFKDRGIPFLKVYNIRNQKIDFSYREQFIDQEYHLTKLKRSVLSPGDVVMNIVGPPLGKVAIIPDDFKEWNCNQAITFFRPVERELNSWIYTFLCAGTFLDHIELIGSAGQDNISVTKSKSILIPVPPLEEQEAVIKLVEQLGALMDQLEMQFQNRDSQRAKLLKSSSKEMERS